MYSKKLTQLMENARESAPTEIHRIAIKSLQMRVDGTAKNQACFRCEDADWFLTWQPLPGQPTGSDDEWLLVLGRCAKFMNLASLPDGGLSMPNAPFPFCSSMTNSKEGL